VVSKVLMTNSQAIDWALLPRALMGLLALLCGNGYIVGINQIYDVDIDAVNKPFLPVAAGEYWNLPACSMLACCWKICPSGRMLSSHLNVKMPLDNYSADHCQSTLIFLQLSLLS
jgi:hypothetical protein